VGYWQLFLLGVSGGLVPCPAAIAILLAAIGTGRLGEGLAYILLFSMGLALTLTTIGLVVISAGKLARRMLDAKGLADKAAIASAAIITLIGAITLANSLRHII
jgi:nickel/cobalt exporter